MEIQRGIELVERARKKEKFSIEDQIDYLKYKGIKFDKISIADASKYLKENSYYFKVTAYRKNFHKDADGKYGNIDFAYLKDLAIIDMHLRHLLMCLTLDIEHSIKTHLINLITTSNKYDGYKELKEYTSHHMKLMMEKHNTFDPKKQKTIVALIMDKCNFDNSYNLDLSQKRGESPALWILIELMTFGQLVNYIEYYYDNNNYQSSSLKAANDTLILCKNIRDSSAHNGTLVSDITVKIRSRSRIPNGNRSFPSVLREYLKDKGIETKKYKHVLKNIKVVDLVATIYIFDNYVHGGLRKSNIEKMQSFLIRCSRNDEYYKNHSDLCTIYELFKNLVESLA